MDKKGNKKGYVNINNNIKAIYIIEKIQIIYFFHVQK